MSDLAGFGEEEFHADGHFGVRLNATEYIIRCVDCPYGWTSRGPQSIGGREAARAAMAHAVEFHRCTYKASPT